MEPLANQGGRFYEIVIEQLPVAVQVWQMKPARPADQCRLVAANRAASELLGVPLEAALGRAMADVFPGLCRQGVPQALAEVFESRTARPLGELSLAPDGRSGAVALAHAFRLPSRRVGLALTPCVQPAPRASRAGQLTRRQCDVLQLLIRGHSPADAARILGISEKTVESQRRRILRVMGASSIADLGRTPASGLFAPAATES
jgi:DNA-binding CsgD family transcriptional regulator